MGSSSRQAWLVLVAIAFIGPLVRADEIKWKKFDEADGFALYERDVPGSDLVAFKGDGVLDAPLATVASILLDHDRAPEWVDNLQQIKLIRWLDPMDFLDYSHVGTPFILKDRDFVTKAHLDIDSIHHRFSITAQSVEDKALPETRYVRGFIIRSVFILEQIDEGKRTHASAEMHVDPKGSVPKWIVNLFQRSWPRKAFEGMKKELKKKDLSTPAPFKDIVRQLSAW